MNANERYHRDYVLPTWHYPLPYTQGGKRPDIPSLWERAKEMLARAFTQFPPARTIAQWLRVSRQQRRDFNEWIEPVEHLVRSCIVAKAAIFLLMTPQGRKMLRETQKHGPPPAKTAAASQPAPHKITIPHPGWHTIAQPPRPEPAKPAATRTPADPLDPSTWRMGFRTMKWHAGAAEDEAEAAPVFDKRDYLTAIDPYDMRPRRERRKKPDFVYPARDMARRIEALTRVLANPNAAIMHAARFLAAITPGMLEVFGSGHNRSGWLQGARENSEMRLHVHRAVSILAIAQPRPG